MPNASLLTGLNPALAATLGVNPLLGTAASLCAPITGIPTTFSLPAVTKRTVLSAVPVQDVIQQVACLPVRQDVLVRVPVLRTAAVPVAVPIQRTALVAQQVPVCLNITFAPVAAIPFACPPGVAALDP